MSDPTSEDKVLLERSRSVAKGDDPSRVKRKLFMQLGFGTGRWPSPRSWGQRSRPAPSSYTCRSGRPACPPHRLRVRPRCRRFPRRQSRSHSLRSPPRPSLHLPLPVRSRHRGPLRRGRARLRAVGRRLCPSAACTTALRARRSCRRRHRSFAPRRRTHRPSRGEHRSRRWRHKSKKHPPRALRRWRRKRSSCAKRMQRAKPAAPPALSLCSRSTAPALRTASWCRNAKRNA